MSLLTGQVQQNGGIEKRKKLCCGQFVFRSDRERVKEYRDESSAEVKLKLI